MINSGSNEPTTIHLDIKTKKPVSLLRALFIVLWCGAGSNRRHKDFQSFALPTELPHQLPAACYLLPATCHLHSKRAANIDAFRKKQAAFPQLFYNRHATFLQYRQMLKP